MTEKQREVFVMYYRDCMTIEEITNTLSYHVSTIHQHMKYMLAKAKGVME